MILTKPNLLQIVPQASSLFERLNTDFFKVDATQISEQQVSARLTKWCQVVAKGNSEKFQRRLQWDELDVDTVRPALGAMLVMDGQVLPNWAETLKQIIQTASKFSFQDEFKIPIEPENPLPFADVLLPAIQVARQRLLDNLGSASLCPNYLPLKLLSEQAYLSLERSLLQRTVKICSKTLEFEFSRFRPAGSTLLTLLGGKMKGTASRVHYKAFVEKLLQDGLLAFFQKYPVLARLLVTVIDFWVEATAEFLQRLEAELSEIQQMFNHSEQLEEENGVIKTELGKVIEIKPSLSDPHNRGRCVIALTFESGLKLVYKPKNLGLEVAYNQFLGWCNQHGVPLPFNILKVLNQETHGWVEYVEQLPCVDEAAAQRFYQRSGMLLCLMYSLGGTDCHHENLIASGEHLMLIDMETLIHPEASTVTDALEATEAETAVNQQLFSSVLRTGLLPRWQFNKDKHIAYDISGLGSVYPQQAPMRLPRWKSVNTDDMHLVYEKVTMPIRANVPILNGSVLSPNDYLEKLVIGFQQMYRFLLQYREVLLADDSPLTALQDKRVRFVFRHTKVYEVILEKTLAPEFLKNGVDRSIRLEILGRAFLADQEKPNAWPILQAELQAMEQLDIPYFWAESNSNALSLNVEQAIQQYFKEASYSQVISRLQKLNDTDLAQQVGIIQAAFYASVARTPGSGRPSATNSLLPSDLSQINPLTSEDLVQEAQAIAQEIQEHALSAADGSIKWIGLNYSLNAERFQLDVLGHSLYHGNCGIALFLAALAHVRGSTQFRDLALGALQSVRRVLQTSDAEERRQVESLQTFTRILGIGGAAGLGSIIYSLVRISKFLQETALLEDAQRTANLITSKEIAADQKLDVMQGVSGTILGLLALYNETREPGVLDKAVACGQHLLKHRVSVDNSPRAWRTIFSEQKPLTGFSHGAAGIAYSLLRLYAATKDQAYLEAAEQGIAYEHSVFSPVADNWPDFRSFNQQNGQPGFMSSWCYGAPGIGLARLGNLPILQTDKISQDVEIALRNTLKYSFQDVDQLCCGHFGRIELLLVASQKLSRLELLKTAQKQTSWLIAKARKTGGYQLFFHLPNHVFSPSLFQGTAGIGYELLRLAHPELIPSLLLWE